VHSLITQNLHTYYSKWATSLVTTAQLDTVLAAVEVLAFDTPADAIYRELRSDLERNGQPIG